MTFIYHRRVSGLVSAERCQRPAQFKVSRSHGAKAKGRQFEKAAAKALPGAISGQWYSFWDDNGHGYCQTDLEFDVARGRVLVECKLTDTPVAVGQIRELYQPILEFVYGKTILPIVLVRNLTCNSEPSLIVDNLAEAIELSRKGHLPILHWLGKGKLA